MTKGMKDRLPGEQEGNRTVSSSPGAGRVTMDVHVTIRPMGSTDGQPRPSEFAAGDLKDLAGADETVMDWLAKAPENQALFVLDHARAVHDAHPELPEGLITSLERKNRRLERAMGDQLPQVTFRSIEVDIAKEEC